MYQWRRLKAEPSQAKSTVFVSRWDFLNKYQVARRSFFLSSHIVVYQWAWTKLPLLLLLFFQSHRSNNLHFLLFFVVSCLCCCILFNKLKHKRKWSAKLFLCLLCVPFISFSPFSVLNHVKNEIVGFVNLHTFTFVCERGGRRRRWDTSNWQLKRIYLERWHNVTKKNRQNKQ